MNKELNEVIEAVDKINAELYEQITTKDRWGHEYTNYKVLLAIEYHPGQVVNVLFCNSCVYDSENEDREWIEDGPSILHDSGVCTDDLVPAHWEPIEPYLRRKVNELIGKLSKIKL